MAGGGGIDNSAVATAKLLGPGVSGKGKSHGLSIGGRVVGAALYGGAAVCCAVFAAGGAALYGGAAACNAVLAAGGALGSAALAADGALTGGLADGAVFIGGAAV